MAKDRRRGRLPSTCDGRRAASICAGCRGTSNVPPAATDVNASYHAAGSVPIGGRCLAAVGASRSDVPADRRSPARRSRAAAPPASTINGKAIAYRPTPPSPTSISSASARVRGPGARDRSLQERHQRPRRRERQRHDAERDGRDGERHADRLDHPRRDDSALDFDGSLVDDTAHVKATGSFAGFDPAVASGRPALKGTVAGTLDVDATVANVSSGVTPDSVQADAKVDLEPSTIGGLAITRATLDGDYRDSTGDIRTLEIVGRDVNVQASGTLALNDTGQSNLKVHADTPSLEEIGKLFDQPLRGIGKVDATVTGNRRELQATGNADRQRRQVRRQRRADDLERLHREGPGPGRRGRATSTATTARHVRHRRRAEHQRARREDDLRAEAGRRSTRRRSSRSGRSAPPARWCCTRIIRKCTCSSSGSRRRARPGRWRPARAPTIKYGDDVDRGRRISTLTSGDQQIAADGSFGRPGDALEGDARTTSISPASTRCCCGRRSSPAALNATATVTGTKDAPAVEGRVPGQPGRLPAVPLRHASAAP